MRVLLSLIKIITFLEILDYITNNKCNGDFLPRNSDDCLDQEIDDENEVCCYIYAQPYQSYDFEKQCVRVKKEDSKDDDSLKKFIGDVTEGVYWEDYTDPYVEIKEIVCPSITYTQSECETVENVKGYPSCQGKKTKEPGETCCYLYGTVEGGDVFEPECVDINVADTKDKEGLIDVMERIKRGKYWSEYRTPYNDIVNFRCSPSSECESTDYVRQFYDCEGRKGEDPKNEECCFLYGIMEGESDYKTGCIDIGKSSVKDSNTLESTVIASLYNGTYWELTSQKYLKIDELTCKKAAYVRSPCESVEPTDSNQCTGKRSAYETETCCYMVGIVQGSIIEEPECIDVLKEDSNDLDIVRLKIKNGTYWNDYNLPYLSVSSLTCNNSKFLSLSYFWFYIFLFMIIL